MKRRNIELSADQRQALDSLVRFGCDKLIARELGVSCAAVRCRLLRARLVLNAPNRVILALKWLQLQQGNHGQAHPT